MKKDKDFTFPDRSKGEVSELREDNKPLPDFIPETEAQNYGLKHLRINKAIVNGQPYSWSSDMRGWVTDRPLSQESNKPLYKVLNERRTQEIWDVHGNNEIHPLSDEDGERIIADFTNEDINRAFPKSEQEANAQYTALAVNNLSPICEALENLIAYCNHIPQFEYSNELKEAKEALKRIS